MVVPLQGHNRAVVPIQLLVVLEDVDVFSQILKVMVFITWILLMERVNQMLVLVGIGFFRVRAMQYLLVLMEGTRMLL